MAESTGSFTNPHVMARPRENQKKKNSARQSVSDFPFRTVISLKTPEEESSFSWDIRVIRSQSTAKMVSADAKAVSDAAKTERDGQNTDHLLSVTEEDDRELLKLGYRAVLARGWGTFDNFACSFSALYCIGGIRVLFYIALSNGGPAAL